MKKIKITKTEDVLQKKEGLFRKPYYLYFTDYIISICVGFGIYYWYSLFDWDFRFALFFSFWAVALTQMQIKGE